MFHPSPILFDFGFAKIHWYGLLISISIIIGAWLGRKLFRRHKLSDHLFFDLAFYVIIFGFLGARLWHVFSEFSYYLVHPFDIIKIWQGGLAIHGAIIGGAVFIYFYYRKHRGQFKEINFLLLLDIFAPLVALGQALGRFGNYFNQELYGRPTDLPWGIPIDMANRFAGYENFEYFQPIFLYESLWCFLIFILLIFLHRRRLLIPCNPTNLPPYQPGAIFSLYLILYSFGRFLVGFLRIDPQLFFAGLRLDQWVSMVLFLVGCYFLFKSIKNSPKITTK